MNGEIVQGRSQSPRRTSTPPKTEDTASCAANVSPKISATFTEDEALGSTALHHHKSGLFGKFKKTTPCVPDVTRPHWKNMQRRKALVKLWDLKNLSLGVPHQRFLRFRAQCPAAIKMAPRQLLNGTSKWWPSPGAPRDLLPKFRPWSTAPPAASLLDGATTSSRRRRRSIAPWKSSVYRNTRQGALDRSTRLGRRSLRRMGVVPDVEGERTSGWRARS